MTPKEIANAYIEWLAKGEIEKIIALFSADGQVHSPVYGVQSAKDFYEQLAEDSNSSVLQLKGIFEEKRNNRLAIYFNYKWTLRNGTFVDFDVVDILELNKKNQITSLKIIYDTVQSRVLVEGLNAS